MKCTCLPLALHQIFRDELAGVQVAYSRRIKNTHVTVLFCSSLTYRTNSMPCQADTTRWIPDSTCVTAARPKQLCNRVAIRVYLHSALYIRVYGREDAGSLLPVLSMRPLVQNQTKPRQKHLSDPVDRANTIHPVPTHSVFFRLDISVPLVSHYLVLL